MLNLSNIDLARQYRTAEDELRETKSYIYQLVEELDFRLGQLYGDPDTSLSDGLVDVAKKVTLDYVHPVGEIFISVDETFDPNKTWGGTWERLTDKFLVGAGNDYDLGDVGGEATHTLNVSEMPWHGHLVRFHNSAGTLGTAYYYNGATKTNQTGAQAPAITWKGTTFTAAQNGAGDQAGAADPVGGGQAHNNLPPYEAVYMWKRIA